MKTNKIISLLALTALLVVACEPNHEPIPAQDNQDIAATHTLQGFLETFLTDSGVLFPVRTRANGENGTGFFSVDTLPTYGDDIIIKGRVVSDDRSGNLYKTLIIQDTQYPEQGLRISVDASNISGLYPMGQVISIRCNGLAVGKYATQPQLAVPSYNNNTDAQNASQKVGWAPGRIPLPRFRAAVTAIGKPELDKIVVDTMTIPEILASTPREMEGRLVCIKNIHFNQKYANTYGELADLTAGDPSTDTNAKVFAPTTNFVGYPQGRAIEDGDGNWILVSTSEYAKFAYTIIPEAEYVGTVTGIVGNYRDNARYAADDADWSITLRSLDDLQLFNAEGKAWEPQEWESK